MQTTIPDDCRKDFSEWVSPHDQKVARDKAAHDSMWKRSGISIIRKDRCADQWSDRVKAQYEPARRMIRVLRWHHRAQSGCNTLERLFREQVERWKTETQHWSSVTRMLAHPSYLRIVALAKLSSNNEIERLLLEELEAEPDHWFDALTAITDDDPVQPQQDFDGAVQAWLEWGRQKGIIGIEDDRSR